MVGEGCFFVDRTILFMVIFWGASLKLRIFTINVQRLVFSKIMQCLEKLNMNIHLMRVNSSDQTCADTWSFPPMFFGLATIGSKGAPAIKKILLMTHMDQNIIHQSLTLLTFDIFDIFTHTRFANVINIIVIFTISNLVRTFF